MGLSLENDFVHLSVPYEESAGLWPPACDTRGAVSINAPVASVEYRLIRDHKRTSLVVACTLRRQIVEEKEDENDDSGGL